MKNLICVFILMILNSFSFSQQNFWEQTNGPHAGFIEDICINHQNKIFTTGVYRSVNLGESWELCNNGISVAGPNKFAVNSLDHIWGITGVISEKLFYSTNDGEMWQELSPPIQYIKSIAIDSEDNIFLGHDSKVSISTNNGITWNTHDLGYTEVYDFAFNSLNYIYAATYSRIWRSTDNGSSWIEVLNGNSLYTVYVDNNDIIYVGSFENIYKSTNNGDDWITITNNITGQYFYAIASNPLNELFVGCNQGIYKSTDLGETWLQKNNGIRNLNIMCISVDNNGNIFTGTEWGGIYKTTNTGEDWLQTGIPVSSISSLVILSNDMLFASGSEIFRTTNNGSRWNWKMNGLTGSVAAIARNPFGEIVAATFDTIYTSSDYGESWVVKGTGNLPGYLPFEISPSDQIFVGAMGSGFFRSTDYGNSWIHCISNCYAHCIAFDSSGNTYAGHSSGIKKSSDSGINWTDDLLDGENVYSLVVDHQNNIYASSWSANGNFYKSTDYGNTWVLNSTGVKFGTLCINREGILFGGENIGLDGVYRSIDDGVNWEEINDGLYFEHRDVNELAINSQGFLFAATSCGSVYKSVETVNDVKINENIVIDCYLNQNYPNPFNPSTKIRYSVPQLSKVVIKVFDVVGNEIETLINEEKPVGTYELTWYAKGLPSGVYFYRLKAGEFIETKKMVLVK